MNEAGSNQLNTVNHPEVIRMNMDTVQGFEALQRCAKLLSSSPLVPESFRGDKGFPSCVIALNLASRLQADPLMVAQNLYVVQGRPSWSAKFLIATFNQCGRFTALRYQFEGQPGTDDYGCRAWAIERATGERIDGALVSIGIAKKEGWYAKSGSKWQTMPEQMLRYRSAAWMINTHAPELAMGLPTTEEVSDFIDAEVVEPKKPSNAREKESAASFVSTWEIEELEKFDDLKDQVYTAFKNAGYVEEYNVWAALWSPKRGKGDSKGTIRDMERELENFTSLRAGQPL